MAGSSRGWSGIVGVLVLAAVACGQAAQARVTDPFKTVDPPDNPTTAARAALGEQLFESPLLSGNRKISCATCHDPAQSFADGRGQSKGIFEVEVGRNSPTLVVVGLMPGFRGPPPVAKPGAPAPAPKALTLEGRCVSPIENPLEMGSTLEEAVTALKAAPGMKDAFDHAFGQRGTGITADRIGKALAAYLRSIRPSDTPYRRFLAGDKGALSDEALRGLALFNGVGRCASCHAGPALTDGLFHDALAPGDFRARQQGETSRRTLQDLVDLRGSPSSGPGHPSGKSRPSGSARLQPTGKPPLDKAIDAANPASPQAGYNPILNGTGVQTPTLWDVSRTGPYFRDGSVADLDTAVAQHIVELRAIRRPSVVPRNGMEGCGPPVLDVQSRDDIPETLKPKRGERFEGEPMPAQLNAQQSIDLIAFLCSLSPK